MNKNKLGGIILTKLQLGLAIVILLLIGSCSFDKNASPSAPVLTNNLIPQSPSPANNSTEELLVVNLKWESAADKFDVYFDRKNPPNILIAKDTTAKKLLLTGLQYDTKYYWKVVAKTISGSEVEGPVWNFTTIAKNISQLNGYAFVNYDVTTMPPNTVKILFQVIDLSGKGITNLTESDFEVYEDGEPISISESELNIKKREQIPYNIYTVLMLDNSTSLKDSIETVRMSVHSLINNLLKNQLVSIYSFSESQYKLQDFTSDTTVLLNALNNYQLGFSTTDLYGSVIKGASLWKDSYQRDSISQGCMVIFTDGKDTQGSHTLAEALNSISNKIVFTVGVGSELNPEVLTRIGTGGFFRAADLNDLEKEFIDIQNKVLNYANSFYLLTYQSPKRGNKEHTLYIKIKNNNYSGESSTLIATYNSNDFSSKAIVLNK
ncbi:VWA domain-containing protein [Melioribacteraceae bacterium 4301-Me]|uniref:VWA domain-containing protein n=1 Tax=Pyranulibacter aquaticus TaxID=3163344 RepID=UPI0035970DB0